MYRFLDKRFHATTTLQFDLQTFACGHVGFSKEYQPSKLKEKLKPAIAELVAIGFIEDIPIEQRYTKVGHGEWQIHLTRQRPRQLVNEPHIVVNVYRGPNKTGGIQQSLSGTMVMQ
jgi:hypothetical protein